MHEDWKLKHPQHENMSYESYRRRVKNKKISFTKLGCEECESCEEFMLHEHKDKNNLQPDCTVCQSWGKHIDLATESRKLYRQYAEGQFQEEGLVCYSADLQKIIMLPRIDSFKAVIFTQRLTTYHKTFAPVGKKSKEVPYAMLWHEALSGRWKEDIISTFYMFLNKQRDAKKIVIWLDNCASQNKNWALLSFLVKMVNSNEISAK